MQVGRRGGGGGLREASTHAGRCAQAAGVCAGRAASLGSGHKNPVGRSRIIGPRRAEVCGAAGGAQLRPSPHSITARGGEHEQEAPQSAGRMMRHGSRVAASRLGTGRPLLLLLLPLLPLLLPPPLLLLLMLLLLYYRCCYKYYSTTATTATTATVATVATAATAATTIACTTTTQSAHARVGSCALLGEVVCQPCQREGTVSAH
eukprot:655724-Prymnesium_polylepis.1